MIVISYWCDILNSTTNS